MADKKSGKKSDKGTKSDKGKKVRKQSPAAALDVVAEFRTWLDTNRAAVLAQVDATTRNWLAERAATAAPASASARRRTPQGASAKPSAMDILTQHGWTVLDDGCWHWQGRMSQGRPVVVITPGRPQSASRMLFSETVRKLTPTERLNRSCRNLACVNPEHYSPR